jgi:hypothetical protein
MSQFRHMKPTSQEWECESQYRDKLFLAGSIEMGKAIDWQAEVVEAFKNYYMGVYNPRRDEWNAELPQKISCEEFRYQVTWEQRYLEKSNIVLMNLLPGTYSPISLLELGQLSAVSKDKIVVVVCPEDFWRAGNVEMVCILYRIPLYRTLAEGIAHIKTVLQFR